MDVLRDAPPSESGGSENKTPFTFKNTSRDSAPSG